MEIFEVIVRKGNKLEAVFHSAKSAQAARRYYETYGYEIVIIKKVTKEYIKEIEELMLEIRCSIMVSDAVRSILDTWFGDILQHYKE